MSHSKHTNPAVGNVPQRTVVTIDGLAGSGKSTLAKLLASALGFEHLNSGLLYRAVGWLTLEHNCPADRAAALLVDHSIELLSSDSVRIDGVVRDTVLTTSAVSARASEVASIPAVRAALLAAQRTACSGKSLIAEGRDMGTVVFPDAAIKFFVSVTEATRISRRLRQLFPELKESDKEYEARRAEVAAAIRERDERDQQRSIAPTVPAADAIAIDNSADSPATALEAMRRHVSRLRLQPQS